MNKWLYFFLPLPLAWEQAPTCSTQPAWETSTPLAASKERTLFIRFNDRITSSCTGTEPPTAGKERRGEERGEGGEHSSCGVLHGSGAESPLACYYKITEPVGRNYSPTTPVFPPCGTRGSRLSLQCFKMEETCSVLLGLKTRAALPLNLPSQSLQHCSVSVSSLKVRQSAKSKQALTWGMVTLACCMLPALVRP